MKLVVDIGNTLVKIAIFRFDDIIHQENRPNFEQQILSTLITRFPQISSLIVSNVRKEALSFLNQFNNKLNIIDFNNNTSTPLKNNYKTPKTLGNDRLAAAVGAFYHFPSENILVIDVGTSITYDLVTEKGEYLGGGISPGIQMRYSALNTFTGKLPLVKPVWNKDINMIGNTTEKAILSGVQFAVLQEVDGMISEYRQKFSSLQILLTGGDYKYFDKYLKNNIFAAPNLVLSGLKKILDFNEDN